MINNESYFNNNLFCKVNFNINLFYKVNFYLNQIKALKYKHFKDKYKISKIFQIIVTIFPQKNPGLVCEYK